MIDRTMKPEELPDWFSELLFLRCTEGLTSEQQRQFDEFVAEHPNRSQIESEIEKFELTVAAVDLSFQEQESVSNQSLPPQLREKIVDGANRFWAAERENRDRQNVAAPAVTIERPGKSRLTTREALAWFVAAASIILLLSGVNPFGEQGPPEDLGTQKIEVAKTINEELEDFLASNNQGSNLKQVSWEVTPNYKFVETGDIVWRDDRQEGYMTFTGLPANNPKKSQYQLWIFDQTRPENSPPVDGGVFDVVSGKTTVIRVDAKLPVGNSVMFAITEEIPGGVVVSDQKRLPLLAKVSP